tara:strand:- start:413 stop:544 length:132 start_codon:yes stop_codon:yes gene_type:complete
MTIALRLGKTMDEIGDIPYQEYRDWVEYFSVVDEDVGKDGSRS